MKSFGNRCRQERVPQWAKNLEEAVNRLYEGVNQINQFNKKVDRFMSTESAGQSQIDADVNAIEAGLSSFEASNSAGFATLSAAIAKLVSGQTPATPDNLAALDQLVADVQSATSQAGASLAAAISQSTPGPVSP